MTLLDATSGTGRVLLGILAGGGLRIGEALALRWQHIDLGTGTLHVVDAKTPKGIREVHLTPSLREELTLARAGQDPLLGLAAEFMQSTPLDGGVKRVRWPPRHRGRDGRSAVAQAA